MSKVDTTFILEVFRNEYSKRLNSVIGEAEVFDDGGKMILSPDLKVRHKDSGFEYTIDKIDDDSGDVKIHLRTPETPRVEPAPEERSLLGEPRDEEVLGEQDPPSLFKKSYTDEEMQVPPETEEAQDPNETVFIIDQSEFEKEYEVD